MGNIYRKVNNEIIFGRSLPVLVKDRDNQYILTDLEVYRDGTIICRNIGDELLWNIRDVPLKTKVSFDEFERLVALGKFVTTVPEGASLRVSELAILTISQIESLLERASGVNKPIKARRSITMAKRCGWPREIHSSNTNHYSEEVLDQRIRLGKTRRNIILPGVYDVQ